MALPRAFLAELGEFGPVRSSGAAALLAIPGGPAAPVQAVLLAAAAIAPSRPEDLAAPAQDLAASLRKLAADVLGAGVVRHAPRPATRGLLRVVLGVSRRKLRDGCSATVGVGSSAYLGMRRLVLVRRALGRSAAGPNG